MKKFRVSTAQAMQLPTLGALMCLANLAQGADVQLQTKVYGFLNAEVESVVADGGATPVERRGRISDGNSRLGYSGSIAINDTSRGLWQLEGSLNSFDQGGVNDQGNTATLSSRNTYVGIEDDRFGRLILGNNDSAYRSLAGSGSELGGNLGLSSHGLDLWNNTSAQMSGNANSVFGRGEARYKNSAHYFSPSFSGIRAAVSYGFDEVVSNGANRDRFAVALKYSNGPFQIGAAYDHQRNTGIDITNVQEGHGFLIDAQTGPATSYSKLIASYKLPTKTYIGIGLELSSYGYQEYVPPSINNIYPSTASGDLKQRGAMVSIAQDLGDASVMLSYGKLGGLRYSTIGSPADFNAHQLSLGALYNFNSWLASYAYATNLRNGSSQQVNLGQSPVYSNSTGTNGAYLSPGSDVRAAGVGLIARF